MSALAYLHHVGIVHRDVKAENVAIHKDRAVLLDFGISAWLSDEAAMAQHVGTLAYTAPEIINKQPYNEMVDVFAAGILAHWLYFGMFPAPRDVCTNDAVDFPERAECPKQVPDWVQQLLARMLSQPAKRPGALECYSLLYCSLNV